MENKCLKLVYIAGPLSTGGDGSRECIVRNVEAAEAYTVVLANTGIFFFCAHIHTPFHRDKGSQAPEEFYYQLDFEILKRAADAVIAIPGWEKSYGARREVEWANENNVPVFYPVSPDDMDEIITWSQE